jgi:hypothetical protein
MLEEKEKKRNWREREEEEIKFLVKMNQRRRESGREKKSNVFVPILFFFLKSNVNIIYKAQRSATLIQRIYKRNPYGIYKEHIFKNSSIVETSIR